MSIKTVAIFSCSVCIAIYFFAKQISGIKLSELETILSLIAVVTSFIGFFVLLGTDNTRNKKDIND